MATFIKNDAGTTQIDFIEKPIWLDFWNFQNNYMGSETPLVNGGVVIQRFDRAAGNLGKNITLQLPWVTFDQLQDLWTLIGETDDLVLKPEDAATEYSVFFRVNNPMTIRPQAGLYPDEDKGIAGEPYDRYAVTLHLIVSS